MATVNFCERLECEAMGKSIAMGTLEFRTAPGREERRLELCPGCVADLVVFLKGLPEGTKRQRSYSEPWNPEEEKMKDPDEMTSEELAQLYVKKLGEETRKILEA